MSDDSGAESQVGEVNLVVGEFALKSGQTVVQREIWGDDFPIPDLQTSGHIPFPDEFGERFAKADLDVFLLEVLLTISGYIRPPS